MSDNTDVQTKAEEFANQILKHFNANQAAEFVIACKTRASRCYENAIDALYNTNFNERGLAQAKSYVQQAEYWDLVDGIISRKIGDIPG